MPTAQTVVREPVRSRDHTEIALRELGAEIRVERRVITLARPSTADGPRAVRARGSFFGGIFPGGGALVPDSELMLRGVGLNPTRSALLDVLASMGASIRILDVEERNGELVGQIQVKSSPFAAV